MRRSALILWIAVLFGSNHSSVPDLFAADAQSESAGAVDLSPTSIAVDPSGRRLYLACAMSDEVLVLDRASLKISGRWKVFHSPSGLALSRDGTQLFVSCAAPVSQICVIDTGTGNVLKTFSAGHTAVSPVLRNGAAQELLVCNRFNDAIAALDPDSGHETGRIQVRREPVSAALTPDQRYLLVANHLPHGRSDVPYVAATVTVADLELGRVVKDLRLPNGSINLRQISVAPDGHYAALALTVGRYQVPVTHLSRGWVNTSALAVIDLGTLEVLNTVLLDDVDRGAANPWGVAWSVDSRWLAVTHAGTHELSIIDFPLLVRKLKRLPEHSSDHNGASASHCQADVPNDLSFVYNLRRRVHLRGNGPRAVAVSGERAYVADYFSDTLEVVDLVAGRLVETVPLNPRHELTLVRRGEMYFNDATLCFQGWQSCASCHDDDGRVDGLNWDLLNDGIGNPKDTKSLVLSHRTPPVMSLGVRATAKVAVRSGIQSSLSSVLPEEVPAAMDAWLETLRPAPSPYLMHGRLSEAAERGEKIFKNPETGCASCHEPELYTDLHTYPVGTETAFDKDAREFDTPTLHELWRTAPYLHDGSAATLREVLTTRNRRDQHGKTSHLDPGQLSDLIEFLLSL